jgi:putative glutamine amidotransferase
MKIGVTDTMISEDKFKFYVDWLLNGNVNIEIVRLSYVSDNLKELDRCNSVLITGGNDVDPLLYNGPINHRLIKSVDRKRDDFERKVVDKALTMRMPLLAICRGMQLVNVHFGGTLIPDIEEAGYKSHRTTGDNENFHPITIDDSSILHSITEAAGGMVNSYHHQGIGIPGEGLKITARADDGIIEAMELDGNIPFCILLQWHPERMKDTNNPLTTQIRNRFLLTTKYS